MESDFEINIGLNSHCELMKILTPCNEQGVASAENQIVILKFTCAVPKPHEQLVGIPLCDLDCFDPEKYVSGIVRTNTKKNIVRQIREAMSAMIQNPMYTGSYPIDTGWYQQPETCFVAGDNVLSGNASSFDSEYLACCKKGIHLATPPNMEQRSSLQEFLRCIRTFPGYRIPVFTYALAASLNSLWPKSHPFACALYVVGKSGCGKTTLVKNYCQLYDRDCGGIADCYDARATLPAMKQELHSARDRVVLYDDVAKCSDKRNQADRLNRSVELLRLASNKSSQIKCKGDRIVNQPSRAGFAITAEFLPEEPSEITRCIVVHIQQDRIGGSPRDRELASYMLQEFLCWFSQNIDTELSRMKTVLSALKETPHKGTERLWISLNQMVFVFQSFLRFVESVGFADEADMLLIEASSIYKNLFDAQVNLLRVQEQKLAPYETHIVRGIINRKLPVIPHKGCFCVDLDILTRFLQISTGDEGLSARKVSAHLRANEMVAMDQSKRSTKKLVKHRTLFLIPSKIDPEKKITCV